VWWRNRFEIGTRITSFELTDAKRPMDNRFLGSINRLKEDENYAPTKVYANAWLLQWLGVGLSYESIGAETWTEKPDVQPYTDGTFNVGGPILSAFAAWPNSTRFTPFAEVGQWFMSGSVDADPAWANAHGIEGYQDFEITECKGGSVLGAGCAIQLTRHVELDVIYRQIKASIMVDHLLLGSVAQSGREFPLDSNWMGAGIKYRF
jgi:opacity protein-like surface antigen